MKNFKIDQFNINDSSEIFLIAECGVNHIGKFKYAIKLIDEAAKSGFNAVKFQTYIPDLLVNSKTNLANYQKKTNFSDQKKMLEKYSLSFEEFYKLSKYCKKKKIIFLSTPFDNLSAKFLYSINTPAFKISSADLDNYHLLDFVKKFNKPIILSTGMSNQNKINKTLEFLNLGKSKLALMHCVSEYPTKISNSNLGFLSILKKKKLYFGVSDHTVDEIVSYVSCGLGIKLFEKHITLSKKFEGPDHIASLEAKNLKKFVRNIREIEQSLKNDHKKVSKEESNNLKVVSRKFFFSKKLIKNHQIKYDDIVPIRSDNKNGLGVNLFLKIINRKLKKNVNKMEILTWQKIRKK